MVSKAVLLSTQPDWWTDYSLINDSARQDGAVATQGQAKHVVEKTYQYLEDELINDGGAGPEATTLYTTYCVTAPDDVVADTLPLTVGQLKYLAKPFYDRLNSTELGFDTSAMNPASNDRYPWTVDQDDDADLALATLGQLKFVFSFDLIDWLPPSADADRDQLPDYWEQAMVDENPNDELTTIADVLPEKDYDADGLTNESEFSLSSNPLKKDHPTLKLQLY